MVRVDALPKGAARQAVDGDVILAYGEVTGHAHRIKQADCVLMWSAKGQTYVEIKSPAALTHEEHGTLAIAPGIYRVAHQREYTPEEVRRVQD